MIGAFGSKVFKVDRSKVLTFYGFSRTAKLSTEKQDTDFGKPATYVKGSDLETISMSISLQKVLGINVEKEIEDFIAIQNKGKEDKLIIGGKPLGKNKWLLTGVSAEYENFDSKGKPISATLKLSFEEFAQKGNKPKDNSKAAGISSGTSATMGAANSSIKITDAYKVSASSDEEKEELKRNNKLEAMKVRAKGFYR